MNDMFVIVVALTAAVDAMGVAELDVPKVVLFGDPIPVRLRVQNGGDGVLELSRLPGSVALRNTDSGERFVTAFAGAVPLVSSTGAEPQPLERIPQGGVSKWYETNLLRQVSTPRGCPYPLELLPPGRYELTMWRAAALRGKSLELSAKAEFTVKPRQKSELEEYAEWRKVASVEHGRNPKMAADFKSRYPRSPYARCAEPLEIERLARIDPDEAQRRLDSYLANSSESLGWNSEVRRKIEIEVMSERSDAYVGKIMAGRGPSFDAFRAAIRGPVDEGQVDRLREVVRAWPGTDVAPEAMYLMWEELNRRGECRVVKLRNRGTSPTCTEADAIRQDFIEKYTNHPRRPYFR